MATTPTPVPPQPEPDEGFLHSLATSLGVDPEAVVAASKAIYNHPLDAAKEVGSELSDELIAAGAKPLQTAKDIGRGIGAQMGVNPEAQATAKKRFSQPGIGNKLAGAEEYISSGLPLVGGNLVKAEEQGAQGNLAGSAGTTIGTVAPFLTETEPVSAAKTHLAETAKNFVESAKEEGKAAINAKAPEGSLEAGFAKIGGKKVSGPPEEEEPNQRGQGGHAGGGVSSVEELNRPGRFVRIKRNGLPSEQGKSPDFNLQPGEVGYQVKPDGSITKIDGQETPMHKAAIEKFAKDMYPQPKPEFQQTLAARGQMPEQTVTFPPEVEASYVGGLVDPAVQRAEIAQGHAKQMIDHYDAASEAKTQGNTEAADAHMDAAVAHEEARYQHMQLVNRTGKWVPQETQYANNLSNVARYMSDVANDVSAKPIEKTSAPVAAPEPKTISDKLVDTYGTTNDPIKAGFILSDGRMVPLNGEHNTMLQHLYEKYGDISMDDAERTAFINNENAIRTRVRTTKGGTEVVFSIPKSGVNPDQIEALKKSVAAVGRYGNAVMEISEGEGASTKKEFVTPKDVEPMLREIGAHPESKEKPRGGSVSPTVESEKSPAVTPNKKLQASAQRYAKTQGMDPIDHSPVPVDLDRAKEIARAYDAAKHDPDNPRVKAAYDALKSETLAQFHHLKDDLGLKFEPQEEDPYKSAGEMMADVKKNNRLKVFTGSSTGADHPLSEVAPGTGGHTYNTIFRWVHDAMGHAAGGNDFSEGGEKSATEAHAQMYSDTARPAMRNETEGQTSWFFHNPEVESGAKQPGEFAEQKASILPDTSADWHQKAGTMAAKNEAGGINPRTGKSDSKGFGTELMPEYRQPLDHAPTAEDFKKYYDQHQEIFDAHPELRIGWDNKSAVEGGHEINIGAVGKDAARVAKKLDQKSAFDIAKGEIVPTGGTGLRTSFPNYPIEERIKDLKGENQSNIPGFEHLSKDIYDHLESDERDKVEGNKNLQRAVMTQYHKIAPSVPETTNAMQAGAALGGWWKRYIDVFHGLMDTPEGEQVANQVGPSHAEILKQWHAALSANKSVEDANNLAWHTYADWLDAGKPTDRKSINDIVLKNGAQPEGSGKKGNAAISDTLGRKREVEREGIDTSKIFNLVNSPEMRGERPFTGDVFRDDTAKNPLMGKGAMYRKVPSMGATVAGKGNLNRLVIDTHIRDFYGYPSAKGTEAQYLADSAHLRQAAESLGLKGGEGQEQLWGTVLGLKSLLKQGLTPEEAGSKLNADVINRIGKDYAEVIANDPEITKPGGVLDRLKDKYGIGRGSAGISAADRAPSGTGTSEGRPAGGEAPIDTSQLGETARRIRGQISDSKIKQRDVPDSGSEDDGDTSFEFGANEKPKPSPKGKGGKGINAMDLINALSDLKKSSEKIPTKLKQTAAVQDNMNDPDTRFNAARHEAAHAVISEMLNPGSVNSTAITSSGGVTDIQPPAGKTTVNQLTPDEIRNMIATTYAGGLSEQGGTTKKHVSGDQAAMAQVLAGRGTKEFLQAPELQADARARVNALLADPKIQDHISNLTTHITTKGKLTGDEVRAILKSK